MEEVPEMSIKDVMPSTYDPASVHRLLKNGTRSEILQLLEHKIDLNCTSEDGDTAVHAILRNEKLIERHILEILTTLIDKNVKPNILNKQEVKGLHLAVERRLKDTVNFLLKFEANINTTNKSGNSIAHFFIEDEHEKWKVAKRYPMMNTLENREIMEKESIRFLEFLVSKDIDFDCKNKQGNSALHLAIMYQLLHILPTLLERTNDIKLIDKDNTTLLHLFLEGKSQLSNEHFHSVYISKCVAKCVEILLGRRVPVLECQNHGCSLISNAIKVREEMDIIRTLINYYLKKCDDDRNLAATLFYELMNTCALWNELDADYFLTVLTDLILKGINIHHEIFKGKRFQLTEKVMANSLIFDFMKDSGFIISVRSSLLHMLAEQRNYQGSNDDLYNHICDLVFCGHCEVSTVDKRGKSVLQTAIACGNIPMIPMLIELGADVNNRDDSMRTPLHDAMMMPNEALEIVGLLLSKGADVNAKDNRGDTPLHLAAYNNKVAIVGLLLQHGASVECRNRYKKTPLHLVRWGMDGAVETMDLLLSYGADVNVEDQDGKTPLHLASAYKNVAIVRKLLETGASVNCRDKDHLTPLHHALAVNATTELVDLLLSSGADVNVTDSKGETPLLLAVSLDNAMIVQKLLHLGASVNCKNEQEKTPLHRAVINRAVEIIVLLLSRGANVNVEDDMNETPLHLAVSHNNVVIVTLLLQHGAFVNCRNKHQQTPLHQVRWQLGGSAEIVELLLKTGADVNAKSASSEVPLMCAFSGNNASIILLLLQYGASVDCQDKYLQTPLHRALSMNTGVELVEVFLTRGADINAKDYVGKTPLIEAIDKNDFSLVRWLIEHGAHVNVENNYRQTPLHRALTMESRVEIVELLVTRGADVNAKDHEDSRPLHHVLKRWATTENEYIVRMLLSRGADVNVEDHMNETPLHLAVSHNDLAIVMLLLQHGAFVNCQGKHRQTPLHRVCWQLDGAVEFVELLLTAGAEVNAMDHEGKTPLHAAVASDKLPIVRSLLEHGASVNARDNNRQTPLHRALTMGASLEIVESLVTSGSDVNAKDREGNRPLHHLLQVKRWTKGDKDCMVKMLLRRGAYVNARNNDGKSALFLALKNCTDFDELLKYGADLNDPGVRSFLLKYAGPVNQHIFRQNLLKLKAVDLPFHEEYEARVSSSVAAYREYYEKCLREVAKLKETFISSGKSLYDFLHARSTRRKVYMSSDKLRQLVESSRLVESFPEYSMIILASYHEAETRAMLLKAAQKGLNKLIQVQLPDADRIILDYLSDEDLINIIDADTHDEA